MYVEVSDVKKSYGEGGSYMQVLKGVSVGVEKGKMCVIQGTSGSGKSTLLNCIGGLDVVDSGSIQVDGQEMVGLKMDALSDYRRDYLGFIFQFYNLVPNLTVRENIQVCEYLTDQPLDMDELLDVLGLTEHQNKFPSQLSGGQQQRVLLARALCATSKLLLLDEPVAGLDPRVTAEMYELIQKLNREGITIIMVSHDTQAAAQYANKVLHVSDKPEFFDSKEAYLKSAIGRQYADYAATREEGV